MLKKVGRICSELIWLKTVKSSGHFKAGYVIFRSGIQSAKVEMTRTNCYVIRTFLDVFKIL